MHPYKQSIWQLEIVHEAILRPASTDFVIGHHFVINWVYLLPNENFYKK